MVGCPHDVKGQAIYAFVTLMAGSQPARRCNRNCWPWSARRSAASPPDHLQWAPSLPKTRSGKIMRRILRKIACNELDSLGDTSTLADPGVVQGLIDNRLNR